MYQMSMKLLAMFDQNPTHIFDKLDLEHKYQSHSRNQKTTTWGTKNLPPKKFEQGGPLVIGVMRTPMLTRTPTAVKQYVDPHPTGGVG